MKLWVALQIMAEFDYEYEYAVLLYMLLITISISWYYNNTIVRQIIKNAILETTKLRFRYQNRALVIFIQIGSNSEVVLYST